MQPITPQDKAKRAAGEKAVSTYFRSGMKIGLGSGTTSHWMVRALAVQVHNGLDIVGVPTSTATRDLALSLGIKLVDLNDIDQLDVTIDGPDEIDSDGTMIKGGGACLLWEKIVAQASKRMVVVADNTKMVSMLGKFPLPIEVIPFAYKSTERSLRSLFSSAGYHDLVIGLRMQQGEPVKTDSGNLILDCHLGAIQDAAMLAPQLNQIAGVVENGLFFGIAHEMVVGYPDGHTEVRAFSSVNSVEGGV